MHQLLQHKSQATAFRYDFYPFTHSHFTTALIWVEERKGAGQRVCHRLFDPINKKWQAVKEGPCYDLVFLFHNPQTNMVIDQCVNLTDCTVEQIHHIIRNYYLSPEQRKRILEHAARRGQTNNGESLAPLPPFAEHPVTTHQAHSIVVVMLDIPFPTQLIKNCPFTHHYVLPPAPPTTAAKPTVGRPIVTGTGSKDKYTRYRAKANKKDGTLDMSPEQRAAYHAFQGTPNPDNWTDEQIDKYIEIDEAFKASKG